MAYRYNFSDGSAMVDVGLLWQDEFLFNYQPVFLSTYTKLDFGKDDITISQEIFTEIPVVSELPNFAPPLAVDDNLLASSLNTTFNLFADNGLGADSDADGDNLLVTMINGTILSIGAVITLNNGLEVTYLGGGDVEFNTVGLSLGDFADDVFNYTIDDGNGGTDTANVTISFVVNAMNLAILSAAEGYRIFGALDGMGSGTSVSGLGDVNGDKIDDYIIGAPFAGSGAAYVVFGSVAGFPTGLDLSTLNGVNGFSVDGLAAFDRFGRAVSSAGDINGDGIADILIGAPSGGATNVMGVSEGEAYVIFGSATGFPANFNLTSLNGTNGFVITARPSNPGLGFAVTNAGDVNGDGIDDLLVGSQSVAEVGQSAAAFVVYGTNTGFAAQIDLALLDGTDGFVIPSLTPIDGTGESVTALGDVNGDGIDDFAVGAPNANAASGTFSFTGETYVIFGNAAGFGANFDLTTLNGANGFVVNAIESGDSLGHSVTGIGDINGDGLADILIGAPSADSSSGVVNAGQAYVVYGASSFTASLDLSSLNGLNGFAINGINGFDNTGYSVSGVGDFNGDGIADFVIGARDADPNGNSNAGQTYLIFGGSFSANPIFDVADLDGTNGFALLGARAGDNSGYSVSGAGDINNDGFDDLLIGAPRANNFGNGAQGESYIIYGFDPLGVGNTPPIAADDNFTTNEDNPVTGNVFADNGNGADSDSDGDAIFVSAVNALAANVGANIQGSTGGIFVIQPDGTFSFRANGDFDYLAVGESETTTTSYTVSDGNGGTDIATVAVTVTGVNDAPFGFDPTVAGGVPGDPANYIPSQDVDDGATVTDLDLTPYFGDPDTTDKLTITVDIAALPPGMFYDAVSNTIAGTPDASASQGGPNGDGVYTITVTATDNNNAQFSTNVIYRVSNPAPIAESDSFITDEATAINGNVFENNGVNVDFDLDGDAFFVSDVNNSASNVGLAVVGSAGGLFTISADGSISFDPDGDFNELNTGDSNDTSITYTISDGEGGFSTATVTVTVEGLTPAGNQPIARDDDITTTENIAVSGNVFADNGNGADSDADGDGFVVTQVSGTAGNVGASVAGTGGGLFTINLDGSYSFDPNGEFEILAAGASATTTITYTIDDGIDGSSTATVTVIVNGVNDALFARRDVFTTDEDNAVGGNVFDDNGNGADFDIDGDILAVSAVNGAPGSVGGTVVGSMGGLFSVQENGVFSFQPDGDFDCLAMGQSETSTATYTVTDGNGIFRTATISVTVNGVNDAPFVVGSGGVPPIDPLNFIPVQNVDDSDVLAPIALAQFFGDPDFIDVLSISVAPGSLPPGLTFEAGTNSITGTLSANASQGGPNNDGIYIVLITARDGNGGTVSTNIIFDVSNPAPIAIEDMLVGDPDFNAFNLFADNGFGADMDPDGDAFFITHINGVAIQPGADYVFQSGLTLHFAGGGEIEFTTLQPGAYNEIFTYTISDGQGGTDTAIVEAQFTVNAFDLINNNNVGLTINGVATGDESGFAVSSAGDINDDGFDDFMIGAHFAGPNANGDPGATYVIFGGNDRPAPLGQDFNLSDIDGTNGFVLTGIDQFDNSGWSIDSAGDVNGDGIDDIIISGHLADPNQGQSGEVYVVFGGQNFGASFDLGSLNGTNGFILNGINPVDQAGYDVAGLGDVNGDGIDDFIIGARGADPSGNNLAGESYVVFGQAGGFNPVFELFDLSGANGFTIAGATPEGFSGSTLAGSGDYDGDGINDIMIGIPTRTDAAGQIAIIFGNAGGFAGNLDLGNLNGAGILITGVDPVGRAGFDLAGLGDVNGDGIDDFGLSAPFSGSVGNADSGEIYVIFGNTNIRNGVDLGALDGSNGFTVSGLAASDNLGFSLSSAGDFDGDGFADIIIGAPGLDGSGGAFLIYGRAGGFPANFDIGNLDGNNGFRINGIAGGDDVGFAVTGIGDVDGDGLDDLLIGAPGADANGIAGAGQSYVLAGFSRGGNTNPTEQIVTDKAVISEDDVSSNSESENVSEFNSPDKTIIADDDSFVFVEKSIVSDDDMDWNLDFNEFVIDQDVLAEFTAYAQSLRQAYFDVEYVLELGNEGADSELSYYTDLFNFL